VVQHRYLTASNPAARPESLRVGTQPEGAQLVRLPHCVRLVAALGFAARCRAVRRRPPSRSAAAPLRSRCAEMLILSLRHLMQGREKEICIFTTVRSNPRRRIGFVADPRRINVGLRCLLLIVCRRHGPADLLLDVQHTVRSLLLMIPLPQPLLGESAAFGVCCVCVCVCVCFFFFFFLGFLARPSVPANGC
jgi:AAA domain